MEETVVSTPSPEASGGGDFDSAVDASIDRLASTETDAPTETESAPPDLDQPEQATDEAPEGTPDATAQTPPVEEEIDPSEPIEADRVTDGGKTLHFRAGKAKVLMADHDFANQVRATMPDATVESIKQAYERVVGLDEFIDDFASGDPQRVAKAADNFFELAENPQSIEHFADHVVRTVAQKHPAVYGKVARNVLGGYAQKLYDDAVKSGDEKMLALAQNLDFKLRGKFLRQEDFQNRDPYADRAADLERRERELMARSTQERQQFVEAQVNATVAKQDAEVSKLIDGALNVIPENVRQLRALEYKHAVRDLQDSIEEAKKANPTWVRDYNRQLQKVKSNPSEEAKETLVTMMRQFAGRVIATQKKAVLSRFSEAVKGASATAHKKLADTAARREPLGSNSPVQRPGASQKLKGAKSYDDAWKMLLG